MVRFLLLAAAVAFAQAPGTIDPEGNYIWPNNAGRSPLKRKGIWKINPLSGAAVTPAERAAITATLDRLSAIFKATPEAASLEGYWMMESRTIDKYPAGLGFGTAFFPFALEDIKRNGQYVPQWAGETESVTFYFNRLPDSFNRRTFPDDIFVRPRVTGTYKGFPILEGQDLVIGGDPYAPVSYARALKAFLPLLAKDRDAAEQRLASLKQKNEETQSPAYEAQMRAHLEKYSGEFKTSNPNKYAGRLASMERELIYNRDRAAKAANPQRDADGAWYWNPIDAYADAANRLKTAGNEPACFLEAPRPGTIDRLGSNPACEPLVTQNPAYFNPKLPRTQPQIIIVHSLGRCGAVRDGAFIPNKTPQPNKIAHGCARHPIYWEQLNWPALAALLNK